MATILRVQNYNGRGCYITSNFSFLAWHSGDDKHPTPDYDYGIRRGMEKNEICGFLDEKQAFKWFTSEELDLLTQNGFYLERVQVDRITEIGEYQVLAVRN